MDKHQLGTDFKLDSPLLVITDNNTCIFMDRTDIYIYLYIYSCNIMSYKTHTNYRQICI